jgi:hypothetical protein
MAFLKQKRLTGIFKVISITVDCGNEISVGHEEKFVSNLVLIKYAVRIFGNAWVGLRF